MPPTPLRLRPLRPAALVLVLAALFGALAQGQVDSPVSFIERLESVTRMVTQHATATDPRPSSSQAQAPVPAVGAKSEPPKIKAYIDKSQDGCILCQYIVERISNNVHLAGILPQYTGGRPQRVPNDELDLDPAHQLAAGVTDTADKEDEDESMRRSDAAYRQHQARIAKMRADMRNKARVSAQQRRDRDRLPIATDSDRELQDSEASLLETEAAQFPHHIPLALGVTQTPAVPFERSQPGYRSYTRAIERQKFSEIYHMADMVLDRVCEASMPNDFYPVCSAVFKAQGAITNLLSRQLGVQTVCQRLNFCAPTSYVTRGIHTPKPQPRHRAADPAYPSELDTDAQAEDAASQSN